MLLVGHTHDTDDASLFGHIQPRIKSVTTTGLFNVVAELKKIWSDASLLFVAGVGLRVSVVHLALWTGPSLERRNNQYVCGRCTALPSTSGSTSFHDGRFFYHYVCRAYPGLKEFHIGHLCYSLATSDAKPAVTDFPPSDLP
jgi:hypothetical protein